MEGTAIKSPQWANSMSSRFADRSLSTTACTDSLATIMLGGSFLLPWKTIFSPGTVDSSIQQMGKNVEISPKGFEFFAEVITNPPAPNSNLIRLFRSDSV